MRRPLLYLMGSSHSGSTVLGAHLGGNTGVEMIGELGSISRIMMPATNRLCTCGLGYLNCPIWGTIWPRLQQFVVPASTVNEGKKRIILDNHAVLSELSEIFGHKRTILDTSKNLNRLRYLAADRVDTKVIHLVKNPTSVILSQQRSVQKKALKRQGIHIADLTTKGFGEGVYQWAKKQDAMSSSASNLGLPYLLMRFEDWISDRPNTAKRLSSFLGEEIVLDTNSVDFTSQHHLGGNRVRKRGTLALESEPTDSVTSFIPPRSKESYIQTSLSKYGYD